MVAAPTNNDDKDNMGALDVCSDDSEWYMKEMEEGERRGVTGRVRLLYVLVVGYSSASQSSASGVSRSLAFSVHPPTDPGFAHCASQNGLLGLEY